MKIPFTVLATAASLALPTITDSAAAQSGESASISRDGYCNASIGGYGVTSYDGLAVKSGSGNVSYTCHFDAPPELISTSATQQEGFICWTQFGGTQDSHLVITPSGRVTITCKINRNNPEFTGGDGGDIPL